MSRDITHLNLIQKGYQYAQLENFLDALQKVHLAPLMKAGGPFTVFAPMNLAFLNMEDDMLDALGKGDIKLSTILQHHVLSGRYEMNGLLAGKSFRTLIGDAVFVQREEESLWVNEARILRSDLTASNGTIHIIDRIMTPYDLSGINECEKSFLDEELNMMIA